jgi:hypothetical protein
MSACDISELFKFSTKYIPSKRNRSILLQRIETIAPAIMDINPLLSVLLYNRKQTAAMKRDDPKPKKL